MMRTEKDVGLRMCAYESLRTTTGKKMPPDSKEWDDMIQLAGVTLPPTGASVAGDKVQPSLTPVGGPATSAVPLNNPTTTIQQMSASSPAGLPGTGFNVPAASPIKP